MTRRVALIGSPLRRPHSAVMHNAAFAAFGIDAEYELRPLEPAELDDFFLAARGKEWMGFQVTSPYKQEAAARCDVVEAEAARIGAVNSVTRHDEGTLTGFNTDASGFARAVRDDLAVEMEGRAVAVAGTGGAARAVVDACLQDGALEVLVGGRRRGSARALVEEFGDERLIAVTLGSEFDALLAGVDLAVNATTVGMTSHGVAFDPSRMTAGASLFDLVYVPAETPLLTAAREAGVNAVNGAGMLVAQAEIAFERWTGHSGAGSIMRAAVEPILKGTTEG